MRATLCLIFVLIFSAAAFSQDNALWLRYPAISPDGQTILFEYKGDIYSVPSAGGTATPLTLSESYEFSPVWSHDGKSIAFASDRYGNFDVFVMPAGGGEAKRLTFSLDKAKCRAVLRRMTRRFFFNAARQDAVSNAQVSGHRPDEQELYSVPVTGGRVSQVLTTPALNAVVDSTGTKLIYEDIKGYEERLAKAPYFSRYARRVDVRSYSQEIHTALDI